MATVPCNGCRLCCQKWLVVLKPEFGDDLSQYKHGWLIEGSKMQPVLDQKDNGDCTYLTDEGCSIHDRAPHACKTFDCREMFRSASRPERRTSSKQRREIFNQGRRLLQAVDA